MTLTVGAYEVWRKKVSGNVDEERQTLHVMDAERRVAMVETLTVEGGDPVADPDSYLRYQLCDHLESSRAECDGDGDLLTYEQYHPYGTTALRASAGAVGFAAKRYRYSGKERDEETGLYYYGARYYPAWLGLWTACDPAFTSTNAYSFSVASPVSHSDPDGREPKLITTLKPAPPLPSSKAKTVVPSLVEIAETKPPSAAPGPISSLGSKNKPDGTAPPASTAPPTTVTKPLKSTATYPELAQKAPTLPQDKTRVKVDMRDVRDPLRGEFERRFAKQKWGAPTEKFLHLAETQLAMESGASASNDWQPERTNYNIGGVTEVPGKPFYDTGLTQVQEYELGKQPATAIALGKPGSKPDTTHIYLRFPCDSDRIGASMRPYSDTRGKLSEG